MGKPIRLHTRLSIVKSVFRILAGLALMVATVKCIVTAGVFLLIAEGFGILEEIDS